MVQGIIIDTFAQLKDNQQDKEEDMLGKCFICGDSRENIDKTSKNKSGFYGHIK